jgi:hypothetical protein
MIEEAVIQRLLADTGVIALVGTRVFPGSVPQGEALPAIVFNKISGAPIYADEGEVGLDEARIQIDCWAETYSAAKGLSRAVRASLSAFFGTSEGVESLYLSLDVERDLREGGSNANEYRFRTSMDFIALYRS